MTLYKHRGRLILKSDITGKWFATDLEGEFNTIEQTKNAIDKWIGGYPTKRIPRRWLKDEKLAKEYNS